MPMQQIHGAQLMDVAFPVSTQDTRESCLVERKLKTPVKTFFKRFEVQYTKMLQMEYFWMQRKCLQ